MHVTAPEDRFGVCSNVDSLTSAPCFPTITNFFDRLVSFYRGGVSVPCLLVLATILQMCVCVAGCQPVGLGSATCQPCCKWALPLAGANAVGARHLLPLRGGQEENPVHLEHDQTTQEGRQQDPQHGGETDNEEHPIPHGDEGLPAQSHERKQADETKQSELGHELQQHEQKGMTGRNQRDPYTENFVQPLFFAERRRTLTGHTEVDVVLFFVDKLLWFVTRAVGGYAVGTLIAWLGVLFVNSRAQEQDLRQIILNMDLPYP